MVVAFLSSWVLKIRVNRITKNRELKKDAATVEDLHRRYSGVIYDLCVRILQNKAEAEDATQETFLTAFRFLSSYKYGQSHLPWLYRIGTNVCLKTIRTNRRKGAYPVENLDHIEADAYDPVLRIHIRRILETLVDELDERGLEILVAYTISGMTQSQIADMVGISRRAVVKRLTALRKRAGVLFEEGSSHD